MSREIDRKKLRYSILKELNEGNKKINHTTYGLTVFEFNLFIKDIQDEGLIKGALITKDGAALSFARITISGEDYLSANSKWAKGYNAVKELRDWIPLY